MSINSSTQQISGGIASIIAGLIVVQGTSGRLEKYDVLGYVVIVSILCSVVMLYYLNKRVQKKLHTTQPV